MPIIGEGLIVNRAHEVHTTCLSPNTQLWDVDEQSVGSHVATKTMLI